MRARSRRSFLVNCLQFFIKFFSYYDLSLIKMKMIKVVTMKMLRMRDRNEERKLIVKHEDLKTIE
jgi:hypothetical protein